MSKGVPAVLLGQAVGDALGMPFEKPGDEVHEDLATWDGTFKAGTWHKLQPGHWTDDTEMAMALAEPLLSFVQKLERDSVRAFVAGFPGEAVAKSYVKWFQGTPHGAGSTTKKAMAALIGGTPWRDSGVVFTDDEWMKVGNGTAMRIAPLGLLLKPTRLLAEWVAADAQITHKHKDAEAAALAVALVVSLLVDRTPDDFKDVFSEVYKVIPDDSRVKGALQSASRLLAAGVSDEAAATELGRRGNAVQTVGSAFFYAWKYAEDFTKGVTAAVRAGGDTDTRAAIVGAMLGALHGRDGIPNIYTDKVNQAPALDAMDHVLAYWRECPALIVPPEDNVRGP